MLLLLPSRFTRVQLLSTPRIAAYQAPPSMGFSRQNYWSGLRFPSPGDLPNPGLEPQSPASQAGSSPAEPQGKPKNTGVGSLSLLQRIFPTQESNQGLMHCRLILYQLSYQESHQGRGGVLSKYGAYHGKEIGLPTRGSPRVRAALLTSL